MAGIAACVALTGARRVGCAVADTWGEAQRAIAESMGPSPRYQAELSAQEDCLLPVFYVTKTISGTKTKGIGCRCAFSFVSKTYTAARHRLFGQFVWWLGPVGVR